MQHDPTSMKYVPAAGKVNSMKESSALVEPPAPALVEKSSFAAICIPALSKSLR